MATLDKTLFDFVPATGVVWGKDGSGPYSMDTSGNMVLLSGFQNPGSSVLGGYQQAGIMTTPIRATAGGIIITGPCVIDSFGFENVGTIGNFQAYDDTSAVAANARTAAIAFGSLSVINPLIMSNGARLFANGLFLTIPTGCIVYVNRIVAI